jgi:hypothetical protein
LHACTDTERPATGAISSAASSANEVAEKHHSCCALHAFEHAFSGSTLTSLLGHLLSDETYRQWSEIRNVLAHRAATARRSIQYRGPLLFAPDEPPLAVTQWAGHLHLDEATASSRYDWLEEVINQGVEATAAFAVEQLAYTEDQLPGLS